MGKAVAGVAGGVVHVALGIGAELGEFDVRWVDWGSCGIGGVGL